MFKLSRMPWALLLVVVWALLRFSGMSLAPTGVPGLVAVVACVVVLVSEFYKSGNVSLGSFGWDMAFSVLNVVLCSVTLTLLVQGGHGLDFADLLVGAVILCDAWFSPFNAFRIALRSWTASVNEKHEG